MKQHLHRPKSPSQ